MFNSNAGTLPVSIPIGVGNNGGFGGNTFDDIIALAIVGMIFGWGGYGGFGGYGAGGQSTSVYEGYVLNNDMSMLQRSIADSTNMLERRTDNIVNGICDGFYTTAQQINGVNTNIMQGVNTLQGAVKDCCCQTQQNLADVKYTIGSTGADTNYNIATQANMLDRGIAEGFCQTNFNAERNARNIVDSQTAGTQAILAKLNDMETSRLREKLEAERDARYALQGQLDRAQLRTQIVDDVRPCPRPAYITCNPFGCNCQQNVYGYGTTIA